MQTVTISSTDFDTYANVSQADLYLLADTTFATWDANDDDTKGRFLVSATRILDAQDWLTDYDTQTERETVQPIIDASILIANAISNGDTAILGTSATEAENKRLKAGSVEIENFRSLNSNAYTGSKRTDFPPAIHALLKPYLAGGNFNAGAQAFGVEGTSVGGEDYGIESP